MGLDILCRCRCIEKIPSSKLAAVRQEIADLLSRKEFVAAWWVGTHTLGSEVCSHSDGVVQRFTPGTWDYVELLTFVKLQIAPSNPDGFPVFLQLFEDYYGGRKSVLQDDALLRFGKEVLRVADAIQQIKVPIIDKLDPLDYDYQILENNVWIVAPAGSVIDRWTFCIEEERIVICRGAVQTWKDYAAIQKWRLKEATWSSERVGYVGDLSDVFCPCTIQLWEGTARLVHKPAEIHYHYCMEVLKKVALACCNEEWIIEVSF